MISSSVSVDNLVNCENAPSSYLSDIKVRPVKSQSNKFKRSQSFTDFGFLHRFASKCFPETIAKWNPVTSVVTGAMHSMESSPNATQDAEADEVDSLIEHLDTCEVKTDYEPLPEEIRLMIDRTCQKQRVKDAVWYQSPANWKKVIIMGVGVEKVQQKLNSCAKKFPDFTFETRENGPLHTKQYGNSILSIEEKSVSEANGITWEPSSYATCGLILQGEQLNKDNPPRQYSRSGGLYAVTSAHLSLATAQCEEILSHANPVPIEEMRRQIESSTTQKRFVLKLKKGSARPKVFDLNHPPLFCYRHYSYDAKRQSSGKIMCGAGKCELRQTTEICHHRFMNDIAILPIDYHVVDQIRDEIKQEVHEYIPLCFDKILPLEQRHVARMIMENKRVYVGSNSYRIYPSNNSPGRDPSRTYAYHMAFVADSPSDHTGIQLEHGDSGSVVYVKSGETKYAVGIFNGIFNGGETDSIIYQAIILSQALKDIEQAYPHHVRNLRIVDRQTLGLPVDQAVSHSSSSSARPPTTQYRNK